jgi:hypothetical protein
MQLKWKPTDTFWTTVVHIENRYVSEQTLTLYLLLAVLLALHSDISNNAIAFATWICSCNVETHEVLKIATKAFVNCVFSNYVLEYSKPEYTFLCCQSIQLCILEHK